MPSRRLFVTLRGPPYCRAYDHGMLVSLAPRQNFVNILGTATPAISAPFSPLYENSTSYPEGF